MLLQIFVLDNFKGSIQKKQPFDFSIQPQIFQDVESMVKMIETEREVLADRSFKERN